jgi:RNA polymerase sigma-70 factor (ECF subfamily)
MTDFDSYFLKYHTALLLFTRKFIEDEQQALDLVQEVFMKFWEKGDVSQKEVQVKSFLFSSAKNSCLNYLKHQNVVRKFEQQYAFRLKELEASYYLSGEKSLIEQESLKQIELAIDSLGDIYKEVIFLSRIEGLKNSEISENLHIPVRTVETRIFRALALLKEKISSKTILILLNLNQLKK